MSTSAPHIQDCTTHAGFSLLTPHDVVTSAKEIIFRRGGVTVAKLSPTILVKFGEDVRPNEAKALRLVYQHTCIPVPAVFATYRYGPLDRDEEDYSLMYDTYIFMEFIKGRTLDEAWGLDDPNKESIMRELQGYLTQLRTIPSHGYIGSLENGPTLDHILQYHREKGMKIATHFLFEWLTVIVGPFDSELDFNNALIDAYCKSFKGEVRPFMTGTLNAHKHCIKFTHADFRPANIIVRNGKVAGIMDWEMAGWYPEHWEFVKAFYVWRWQND
jgi:Phosphotransferase enzyme family